MHNIVIKTEQLKFLRENIKKTSILNILSKSINKEANKNNYQTHQCLLKVSDIEIDAIVDELSHLVSLNIDKNGELNKKGVEIDNIIDLFINE